MTVQPAVPAELENRPRACVRPLEPLPNTGEQLFQLLFFLPPSFLPVAGIVWLSRLEDKLC